MTDTIPPDLFAPVRDAVGDLFTFAELRAILDRCYVEPNRLNGIANERWPPRQVADAALTTATAEGTLVPFLGLLLRLQPSNERFRTLLLQAVPALGTATTTTANVALVVSGLNDARAFLGDPQVRAAIETSRETLKSFTQDVGLLSAYKALHDALHYLQIRRMPDLSEAGPDLLRMDPDLVLALQDYLEALETCVSNAQPATDALPEDFGLRAVELRWLASLAAAAVQLRRASAKREVAGASLALRLVESVLQQQPYRLNGQIVAMAARLPLQRLIGALGTAGAPDTAAKPKLEQICAALAQIEAALLRRVADHQLWQEADDFLARVDQVFRFYGDDVFRPLTKAWPEAKSKVVQIAMGDDGDWARQVKESSDLVDDELTEAEGQLAAGPEGAPARTIRKALYVRYVSFRRECRLRFFTVDQLLKSDGTAIVRIGEPLQSILGMLDDARAE